MKQRLVSIVAVLALVVTLLTPAMTAPDSSYGATGFSDVKGHWAESYINTAVNKGFVKGYGDGTFKPENPVTRAEFAKMINSAFGNRNTANTVFTDVPSAEWFYSDVSKAVAAAYVAGYDDKTFKPNAAIKRQEAAVIISRLVPTYNASTNLKSYGDNAKVDDWAAAAMQKVIGRGYMGAYNDGLIHPKDSLTRAQTAKIICDILDKETIVTSDPMVKSKTTLSGKIYTNGVTIHKDLDDSSAVIENCVILGNLSVQGGETVTVSNSRVASSTVNRSSDEVTVVAKGETTISNTSVSNTATLQTSGLSGSKSYGYGVGFNAVNANGSSEVTLSGQFPKVSIIGSSAELIADSASITTLNVETGGRNADITIDSRSSVATANVNAAAAFHGDGTISKMYVNADGVTYEHKPKSVTVASRVDDPEERSGSATFDPKNGATNVSVDKKITITFSKPVYKSGGKSISSSDIDDLIELRENRSTGSHVDFSGSISSSKKIITITPDSDLDDDTKYYVIIPEDTLEDDDEEDIKEQSVYFTTGDDEDEDGVTFSPRSGATDVSSRVSPTITFESAIVDDDGDDITSSYLNRYIIFKKSSSSGSDVDFSASISSSDKIITVSPDDSSLDDGKYYLGFRSGVFEYDSSGDRIPAKSVTFTVGEGEDATLRSLTISNGSMSPTKFNSSTRTYTVALSTAQNVTVKATASTSGDTVKVDGTSDTTTAEKRISVSKDTRITVSVIPKDDDKSTGTYTINFEVVTPTAQLTGLTIEPNTGAKQTPSISSDMSVSVPYETASFKILPKTASGDKALIHRGSVITAGDLEVKDFGDEASFTIEVTGDNKISKSYDLTVKRAKGEASLSSVTVDGVRASKDGTDYTANVKRKAATQTVEYEFTASKGDFSSGNPIGTMTFEAEDTSQSVEVTLEYGGDRQTYTLTVTMDEYTEQTESTSSAIK